MQDSKIFYSKNRFILSLLVLVISVTSCRTIHELPVVEISPMPAYKIMRKIERESPIYNNYESKKISIDYNLNNEKNSFSGQFKNKRNKCIILTIRKLSIPLGKGLITPDSVVFVNYFDKSFLSGDFGDIRELLGIDLDYNLIQALFTADISKVLNEENFDKEVFSVIDSQMYRIDSRLDTKIDKPFTSGKNERRPIRFLKKMNNSEFSDYSLWIDPQYFVVRKIILNDVKYNKNITIRYDQYELVGRNLFPQQIEFESFSPTQKLSILLKLSKSSVNTNNDFSFSVPDKFEKSK
jgi:hypothetical protein